MPLSVLSVAYPFAPAGLDAVGGAEQVLSLVERGLVLRGHRSLVLACEGSQAQGELFTSGPLPARLDEVSQAEGRRAHRAMLEELLRREQVDVVHFHGLDFPAYLPRQLPCAALATLHLPPAWHGEEAFAAAVRGVELVCVSESQRRTCPKSARIFEVVPNGVALDEVRPASRRGEWLVMLGRICPEKGVHLALEAAHRADLPLLIAGRVFPWDAHQRYFEDQVRPLLDERRRFVGTLGRRARRWLLSHARALLAPSLAPETSSLAAMEALASGTPVIAFSAGALPFIVEHGRTGFVVEDVDGMVDAFGRLEELDRRRCRRQAEERFSAETMIDRYLSIYRRLATSRAGAQVRWLPRPGCTQVVQVGTRSELEALRPAWLSLWERARGATPFNHPDWLLPWCRHFGREEVRSVAIHRAGRLVALAPMEVWLEGKMRMLKLLGSGVSDRLDVLVEPVEQRPLMDLLRGAFLEGASGEWDVCELAPLSADSPLLESASTHGEPYEVSPELPLSRGQKLEELLPARLLSNLRYARRRLEREHGARFERLESEAEVDAWVGALVALHRARWSARGEAGVFTDARVVAFHREVAHRFLRAGLLRMWGLKAGGEMLAVLFGFTSQRRFHLYSSGFHPRLERYSPGSLLIARALEGALDEGVETFDFLRGAEPYKYGWGAQDRPLYRTLLSSSRPAVQEEEDAWG